ncbi:MAG: hypothetical protein N2Z21_05335 [Candidatus Sumerlaeaceae bacterium]|nr:hypothetical protein [Candidatus Sumerlaeaceae bacterium]
MQARRYYVNIVKYFRGHLETICSSLFLFPVAVVIVRVQAACATNLSSTLEKFLSGELGPVFSARIFMRLLIPVVWSFGPNCWFPEHANELIQIVATWAGLWACWRIASASLSQTESLGVSLLAGLWLLWGMLPMGFSLAYPYDLPAFALSALGMLALLRRDYYVLMLALCVGILTIETLVWLLIGALVMEFTKGNVAFGWPRVALLILLSACAYLLPRFAITWQSGRALAFLTVDLVENKVTQTPRVMTNLRELLKLHHGSLTENVYWYGMLYLPMFFIWRRLDTTLRAASLGLVVLFAGNFVCGNIWEVRIFNEAVPLGALTALLAAKHLLKERRDCSSLKTHYSS